MPPSAGAGHVLASGLTTTAITVEPAMNLVAAGVIPLPTGATTIVPVESGFISGQFGWLAPRPVVNGPASSEHDVVIKRTDRDTMRRGFLTDPRTDLVLASAVDGLISDARLGRSLALPTGAVDSGLVELASDAVLLRGWKAVEPIGVSYAPQDGVVVHAAAALDPAARGMGGQSMPGVARGTGPLQQADLAGQSAARKAWLADILFAIGFVGYAAGSCRAGADRRVQRRIPRKITARLKHD